MVWKNIFNDLSSDEINALDEQTFEDYVHTSISDLELYEWVYEETDRLISKYKNGEIPDDVFSARELVVMNVRSMVRSCELSMMHRNKLDELITDDFIIDELKHISFGADVTLSPAEILLMKYIDGRSAQLDVPGYFTHKYKLDYVSAIAKMFGKKYLCFAPIEYSLSKCKVTMLKELLKEYSLNTAGKKDELILRIMDNIPQKELSKYENQYFKTTVAGKQLLSDNSHIFLFHNLHGVSGITIDEADKYKKEHPTLSDTELANEMLKYKAKSYLVSKNYGPARNMYLINAEMYQQNRLNAESIHNYFIVCYMDKTLSEDMQKRHPDFSTYADGVISRMRSVITDGNFSASELRSMFDNAIKAFFDENKNIDLSDYRKDGVFEELLKELEV